jgi:hypothetical protein
MDAVRSKFRSVGLATYDCLSPALMDAIASYTAQKAGTAYTTPAAATRSAPSAPAASAAKKGGIAGFFSKLFGG